MAQQRSEKFMRALQNYESEKNDRELIELFAPDARLWRNTKSTTEQNQRGAIGFWKDYLNEFDRVESHFDKVIEDGDSTVLEWTSHGQLIGGKPITYRGVSILDWDQERVRTFRTYFDSAPFLAG